MVSLKKILNSFFFYFQMSPPPFFFFFLLLLSGVQIGGVGRADIQAFANSVGLGDSNRHFCLLGGDSFFFLVLFLKAGLALHYLATLLW